MLICLAFWFWPTIFNLYIYAFAQRDAYTQGCLRTWVLLHRDAFRRDMFSHTHTHTNLVLLHTNAFMHRCFFTGMLLFAGAFTHRCAGISTHRCLYTAMLSHRNSFTHYCSTCVFYTGFLLTQSSLHTQKLYRNTLTRYGSYTGIHCTEVFFYTGTFTKRWFLPQVFFFTKGCFYTRVLLDCDTLGRETLTWARLETQSRGGFKPFWNQASTHSHVSIYTQKMLAEKCFYTQAL